MMAAIVVIMIGRKRAGWPVDGSRDVLFRCAAPDREGRSDSFFFTMQ